MPVSSSQRGPEVDGFFPAEHFRPGIRALPLSRVSNRLDGPFVLSAAWLLSVLAPWAAACSGSEGEHADTGPSLEGGRPDVAVEAGLSLESGSGDAGAPPSGDAASPIAATMNDVSILFPLPSSAADIDNLLAPSATGNDGALLSSALYAAMGPIFGSSDPPPGPGSLSGFAAYGDLRVVAVRIDPCFASLDPDPLGAGCTAQIRLVFQEVRWSSSVKDASAAFDSALHAFYELPRVQFLALARALVELRIANENGDVLGPLAPHPIMVRQGLAGPMSQGVQRLILEYAGEQNLVRTAQEGLGAVQSSGSWEMSAFDVRSAPVAAIPRAIPTLTPMADGGSIFLESIVTGFGGSLPFYASFGSTTASGDDFTALDEGPPASLSASDRQAALDALVRVENPKDNSPDTVDCASCHMATPTEKIVAMPLFAFDDTSSPLAFQPDGTNVTRGDMEATWSAPPNIHAFSYELRSPGISQRVVNETAAVVEYLDDLPQ